MNRRVKMKECVNMKGLSYKDERLVMCKDERMCKDESLSHLKSDDEEMIDLQRRKPSGFS